MNQIEILRPFSDAFDLMSNMLFRPFHFKKWLIIGFTAWLAHIGGGFNFNFNYSGRYPSNRNLDFNGNEALQSFVDLIHRIPLWLMISGIAALLVVCVAVVVLFLWLRARGRFMFIDCIVKNRAAVVEPWREFQPQGDSYFVFSLLVVVSFGLTAILLSLFFVIPMLRGAAALHLHDIYLICTAVLWFAVVMVLLLAWGVVSHFMVMLMYRRCCRATEGFRAALSLIGNFPGEITLYCLFWVVLGIGAVCVACIITCATCCLAVLPYVGTVILLPVYTCLRAFGLCFLRQFGPDYDVWAAGTTAPPNSPAPTGLSA